MSNDTATPKQTAYLTYMGVRNAGRLTKEQASEAIDTLLDTDDLDRWGRLHERQAEWRRDRFILHADLYSHEFQSFLDSELPELLHGYVRNRVVGSSERLTKPKIREIIHGVTAEDREWWRLPHYKELFYERLHATHPGCCDGHSPEKTATRPKRTVTTSAQPGSRGSGCLILLGFPFFIFLIHELFQS